MLDWLRMYGSDLADDYEGSEVLLNDYDRMLISKLQCWEFIMKYLSKQWEAFLIVPEKWKTELIYIIYICN